MIRVLLLVAGPAYHNTPAHRAALLGFLEPRFAVTLSDDMSVLNPENLSNYDVVVNYTTFCEPSADQVGALLSAVESGKGFVGVHGATATFWNSPAYLTMIGGKFICHDALRTFTVNFASAQAVEPHAITAGMADFSIEDELYIVEGDQTQWHILARAEGHPILYTKAWGSGRVCVNSLGHDARALSVPGFQQLTINGIEWAAGLL